MEYRLLMDTLVPLVCLEASVHPLQQAEASCALTWTSPCPWKMIGMTAGVILLLEPYQIPHLIIPEVNNYRPAVAIERFESRLESLERFMQAKALPLLKKAVLCVTLLLVGFYILFMS